MDRTLDRLLYPEDKELWIAKIDRRVYKAWNGKSVFTSIKNFKLSFGYNIGKKGQELEDYIENLGTHFELIRIQ